MLYSRALGLAAGLLLDGLLGDPRKHHPVAWFGAFAARLEKPMHADSTIRGGLYVGGALAPVAAAALLLEHGTRRHPMIHALTTALCTWAVVGARSLAREGAVMADRLESADLAAARAQLPNLCGRDPSGLEAEELVRAAVESMAENTADAAVSSIWWGALAGVPGLLVHRAVNTLDAMVGNYSERYAHFGTAAARLDDLVNLIPARITGATAALLAPLVGGNTWQAWRITRRDARQHPSPNGGWCEAAWAGALGVQLGGRNVYFDRAETRPLLGDGPRPGVTQLRGAAKLVGLVTAATGAAAVAGLLGTDGHKRRKGRL